MNRENIKKVRDVIAGLPPERFDMGWLFAKDGAAIWSSAVSPASLVKGCGTAACIAGWTLATLKAPRYSDSDQAAGLLGLDPFEADRLFMPGGYDIPGTYTLDHAVRVLDHLLETGEVDWKSTRRAKAVNP